MRVVYTVTEGEQTTGEHHLTRVYGITAQMGEEVCRIDDVSPDREEVEAIVRLLEREQLHPIHLYDVIIDLLGRNVSAQV